MIITLVMLLLVTMVSIATIRSNTMEERMAGNARDRDKALQAAEAAVRLCINQVSASPSTFDPAKILTPTVTGPQNWEIPGNWTAKAVEVNLNTNPTSSAKLAKNPRCMVEQLGLGSSYRVTGKAVGASESSVVILQANYSED